jgi:protein-tyrosine-phosphatase
VLQALKELGIDFGGQHSKGLAEVPIQDVDLVVSFGDAHKKCDNLPPRAKVESWPVPKDLEPNKGVTPELPVICDEGEKIQRRVFALLLDHWRNNA